MKEETNATENTCTPTEAQMNDMHRKAWLDFQADAQDAKREVDRRYAKMVDSFGSYKNMPAGVKEILKEDYAAHKAKWGENGEEQQKRFGIKEEPQPEYRSLIEEKEQFLEKLQQQREQQQKPSLEYER